MWGLLGLVLLGVLAWLLLGRLDLDDPWVRLQTPVEVVGAKTALTLEAGDDRQRSQRSQGNLGPGRPGKGGAGEEISAGRRPRGKGGAAFHPGTQGPGLQGRQGHPHGAGRDRSWRNMFQGRTASLSREVVIDLVPITVSFQAVSHLLHAGGTGVIAYRLNKPAKESGVLVGGRFFRGYPNPKGTQGEYVVLFPVPQEGPAGIQVELVARPGLGQEVKQAVALKVKPRKWRHDKLNLSDSFLA